MTAYREAAPAKLNLSLNVLDRLPDGYHTLESVMHTVSLHDDVDLTITEEGDWQISGEGLPIPLNETNLAWKAAEIYFRDSGLRPGLQIHIHKRIPSQAGLGGGSADAAAVFRILNRHYGLYDDTQMTEKAMQAGSDVPFCLAGGAKLVRGKGEILSYVPPLQQASLLIVKPSCACSTAALFRAIDEEPDRPAADTQALCNAMQRGDLRDVGALLRNAFEPIACRLYPEIAEVLDQLRGSGCLGAILTGSGSACFALYENDFAAQTAAECFHEKGLQCFCASSSETD
ncbi:MAG: 4-(cytidine 5'-diphospho)-2-C-methyl-D-erythritol kinase [Oscillospiraceae bacterium]|nr:4-(cytidine 5'-diphospho)-2-C-methyl-D-erythritol kinase [Oscillospiraceae bacterium]